MKARKIKEILRKLEHEQKFISKKEFMLKYNIKKNAFNHFIFRNKDVKNLYVKKDGKIFVNEALLIAFRDFRISIEKKAQKLYFEFKEKGISCNTLSKRLHILTGKSVANWNMFFSARLFKINENSITNLNFSYMSVEFVENEKQLKEMLYGKTTNKKRDNGYSKNI